MSLALPLGIAVAACKPPASALEEASKELPDQPRREIKVVRGPAPDLPTVEETKTQPILPADVPRSEPVTEPSPSEPAPAAGPGPSEPYDSPAVRFTGTELLLLGKVTFEGRAKISTDSAPVLDEVAAMMVARPGITRIEVQAHIDGKAKGDKRATTQARAEAVRDHLAAKGVEPSRIVPKGYGAEMPIDTNRTPEGRAANRRVELVLLEVAP